MPARGKKVLSPFERRQIKIAGAQIRLCLAHCNGDKTAASRKLGLPKHVLYRYLRLNQEIEQDELGQRIAVVEFD